MRFYAPDNGNNGAAAGGSAATPAQTGEADPNPAGTPETEETPFGQIDPDLLAQFPEEAEFLKKEADAAKAKKEKADADAGDEAANADATEEAGDADGDPEKSKDAEPDPDEVPEEDADKPHVKKMLKRIGKLTARNAERLEEIEDLKRENQRLQQIAEKSANRPQAQSAASPLDDVSSLEELESVVSEAKRLKYWALEHLDGADVKKSSDSDETEFISGEAVRKIFAQCERKIEAAESRRQQIQSAQQATEIAQKAYPHFFDKENEASAAFQQARKAYPPIAALPDGNLILAAALTEFARVRAAAEGKTAKQEPAKPKPAAIAPRAPVSSASPAKRPAKAVKEEEALENVIQSGGDEESLMRFFASTQGG